MIDPQYVDGWRERIRREDEVRAEREQRLRALALRAGRVLAACGATRVTLFGSVAEHLTHDKSDIDLAVEGLTVSMLEEARKRVAAELGPEQRFDLVRAEDAGHALRHAIGCGEVLVGA